MIQHIVLHSDELNENRKLTREYAKKRHEINAVQACIVNCGAIIDHGCILEKGVHVAPGGIVKAENRIPAYMKVDSGEVIQNRSYQP